MKWHELNDVKIIPYDKKFTYVVPISPFSGRNQVWFFRDKDWKIENGIYFVRTGDYSDDTHYNIDMGHISRIPEDLDDLEFLLSYED